MSLFYIPRTHGFCADAWRKAEKVNTQPSMQRKGQPEPWSTRTDPKSIHVFTLVTWKENAFSKAYSIAQHVYQSDLFNLYHTQASWRSHYFVLILTQSGALRCICLVALIHVICVPGPSSTSTASASTPTLKVAATPAQADQCRSTRL